MLPSDGSDGFSDIGMRLWLSIDQRDKLPEGRPAPTTEMKMYRLLLAKLNFTAKSFYNDRLKQNSEPIKRFHKFCIFFIL